MNLVIPAQNSTAESHLTPVKPPSVLLMGAAGSGKTWSLSTFVEAGLEVFVLGLEPNAADSLLDSVRARNLPVGKIHFHEVVPAPATWDQMDLVAKEIQRSSYEDLSKIKTGIGKSQMTHWLQLLQACKNFPDDLTGRSFGDVTEWGADRVLVIDSLSGLNQMARQFTVGLKPNMAQGEWGVAMELEGGLLRKLAADRGCFFVLIAHLDRNVDEITQATKVMPAALGNKLAPQIMKDFSEVVLARKVAVANQPEPRYEWSTNDTLADLKNRALEARSSLPPSFVPLVEAHRRRIAQSATTPNTGA